MCVGVFVDISPLTCVCVCVTQSLFCGCTVCPTICGSNPSATAAPLQIFLIILAYLFFYIHFTFSFLPYKKLSAFLQQLS